MEEFHTEYYWKKGRPCGGKKISYNDPLNAIKAFKIVSDPYHKRISVEKYNNGVFVSVVYDSHLFDFRALKPQEQVAWEKTVIEEKEDLITSLVRDHNDRVILVEKNYLKNGLVRSCDIETPHGVKIGKQSLYYEILGDSWNGVILFDREDHAVMRKEYSCDDEGLFVHVIEECWDFTSEDGKKETTSHKM